MRAAIAFLTIVGTARTPDRRTLAWFPIVGALIGAALGGVHVLAEELWPPLIVGGIVTATDLALTGMLHADGLADSADGLLPPAVDRDRRLAIMATPDIGAFGATALGLVLLLRVGAAATMTSPLAFAGVWAASRTAIATVPSVASYARPGGLATAFVDAPTRSTGLWIIPILALLVASDGARGAAALAALLATVAAVVSLANRKIGGYTGDVLGAALILGETTALLALATN